MAEQPIKKYPSLGCCGLDCGLCPRFYTLGSSRCPGCCGPDFFNKHPSCSYITCCVKKKNLEVCSLCEEFPCEKFDLLLREGPKYDSFLTYQKVPHNLEFIKKHGLEEFIAQQSLRMMLLGKMITGFDDGRSRSFYCIAAALLSIKDLEDSLSLAQQKTTEDSINSQDVKTRAKHLRGFLNDFASRVAIELKLRKKD